MPRVLDTRPVASVDDWQEVHEKASDLLSHIVLDRVDFAHSKSEVEVRRIWWEDFNTDRQAWSFPADKGDDDIPHLDAENCAFVIYGVGPADDEEKPASVDVCRGSRGHLGRIARIDPSAGYTVVTEDDQEEEGISFPPTPTPALLDKPIVIEPSEAMAFSSGYDHHDSRAVLLGLYAGIVGHTLMESPHGMTGSSPYPSAKTIDKHLLDLRTGRIEDD